MSIWHPSNDKVALFHLIDKSRWEQCHILTVLKSAESFAHAMISALLPYLQWKFATHASEWAIMWRKNIFYIRIDQLTNYISYITI